MVLCEMGIDSIDWIWLAQDAVQWQDQYQHTIVRILQKLLDE